MAFMVPNGARDPIRRDSGPLPSRFAIINKNPGNSLFYG
jgi:hypothetical protein